MTPNGGSPSFPPPPLSVHGTSGVQELIRYQIHKKRIEQFGPTVGCQACVTFLGTHVPECVARFAMILGALPGSGRVVEAQAQPTAGSAPDGFTYIPAQADRADATWKEFIAEGAEGQRREQHYLVEVGRRASPLSTTPLTGTKTILNYPQHTTDSK